VRASIAGTVRLRARRCAWALGAALAALLVVAESGIAAKWHDGCPKPRDRMRKSIRGAINTPFIHPGHELTIALSLTDVVTGGGFSTAPGGNGVTVTFASLFGEPVELPPFYVAAVSESTLYLTFPDTKALLGHPLAGPVEIVVTTGGMETAHVSSRHLTALPPTNDVAAIIADPEPCHALATMDWRGNLWIPVEFSGFGEMYMPMPNCPDDATFTHVNAFAVGVNVRSTSGSEDTYPPLRAVKVAHSYLGDFMVDGVNLYGRRLRGRSRLLRIPRGFAISVCGLNDAARLALRIKGRRRWAKPWSEFGTLMPSSEPLTITLTDVSADPDVSPTLESIRFDSFGTDCSVQTYE
jgi:hypothetical protein